MVPSASELYLPRKWKGVPFGAREVASKWNASTAWMWSENIGWEGYRSPLAVNPHQEPNLWARNGITDVGLIKQGKRTYRDLRGHFEDISSCVGAKLGTSYPEGSNRSSLSLIYTEDMKRYRNALEILLYTICPPLVVASNMTAMDTKMET